MPDYTKSKIYKLISPSGLIYIGSTVQPLAIRKAGHKQDYLRYKQNKLNYKLTSFKLFEEDENNIEIILIEEFKCNNKNELLEKERYYIDMFDCVNKMRPVITNEEKKERVKQYYKNNKEQITKVKKIYETNNKDKIKKYHKKYKNENKEELKEYYKKWREENKEKMRLYMIEYRKKHNLTN